MLVVSPFYDLGQFGRYSILIGGALESLILSLYLGHKINKIRDDKFATIAKSLEQEKLAKEAQEFFLQSTSHELNTPLNGILGISQNLMSYFFRI